MARKFEHFQVYGYIAQKNTQKSWGSRAGRQSTRCEPIEEHSWDSRSHYQATELDKKKYQRPLTLPTDRVIDEMGTNWKQQIVMLQGQTEGNQRV